MLNRSLLRNISLLKTVPYFIKTSRISEKSKCIRLVHTSYKTEKDSKQSSSPGPDLRYFIAKSKQNRPSELPETEAIPYLDVTALNGDGQQVFLEIYGCQMNVNDADIVWAILQGAGYSKADSIADADVILIVTCALREGAEAKIWGKLRSLRHLKTKKSNSLKIGILGCMAERLKEKVLEKERLVDLVAGPDSYKDLPRLLAITRSNQKAVNVLLSLDETYADVMPVRLNEDSVTSFISIMRGCDNMCTYCIVPFTRGRERSRPVDSILEEVRLLSDKGVKEITLLGQNVNSYRDTSTESYYMTKNETNLVDGFKTVYKPKKGGVRFAELLDKVSAVNPEIRIRFISPHPKDFPDEVLEMIKERDNICKSIHLPAQSGNSVILERMRRGYTREAYLQLVDKIRQILPTVTLTSDFIAGFCGETEEQFQDTVSLISIVRYSFIYFYAYSMREKTTAHRRYKDDVPLEVKNLRVTTLFNLFRTMAHQSNQAQIGTRHLMLVESQSRKSEQHFVGKTDGNTKVIIPCCEIPESCDSSNLKPVKPGDYLYVQVTDANSQNFKGVPLFHTTLQEYSRMFYQETQHLQQII